MRLPLLALAAGVLLVLAGCTARDAGARPALPPVQLIEAPAESAGGACILWDYALVLQRLGVRFDVAASDQFDDTSTCALQVQGADRPDLTLAVVERTTADPDLFRADLMPATGKRVGGLGKAAYRSVGKAGGDHGPVVEVGWLSADRQLITLRFTFARGASARDADAMSGRLVSLAKELDAPIS